MGPTNSIYYRLIAAWVICEAMLGGIIHGLKLPVSGLIVGSAAVVCISLIAFYVPGKGHILKATLIVAIFKMMLSPQAPPPAYFAVFFQGMLGELLFFSPRFFQLSCMVFAVLALVESGLQRIFVLTILYGNDFWKVINEFVNSLTKQKQPFNYSLWLAGIYAGIHAGVGLLVGWWASVLPSRMEKWNQGRLAVSFRLDEIKPVSRKRKWLKKSLLVVWIIIIILYVQSYIGIGKPWLPSTIVLKILLRSIIIVLAWVFLLKPVIELLLKNWLQKKQGKWKTEIRSILALLPETRNLFMECWKYSASHGGLNRIAKFSKTLLAGLLQTHSGPVYILSAPIQSGKTTSLMNWAKNRDDVFGIVTPIINGKRVFMDLHTGRPFEMEAAMDDVDPLLIGKYRFSKAAFLKAELIILDAVDKPGWLVIDEIGPLELRDEGFAKLLRTVLQQRKNNLVLVIRDKDRMVQQVSERFNLVSMADWSRQTQQNPSQFLFNPSS